MPSCAGGSGRFRQSQHPVGIPKVQLGLVFPGQIESVDRLDGLAYEQRSSLGVEGAVGAEQAMVDPEEVEAATDRRARAVDRGIVVDIRK